MTALLGRVSIESHCYQRYCISTLLNWCSRHLLVPSQVTDDTDQAGAFIPVIATLLAQRSGINTTRRRVPHRLTAWRERFMRRPIQHEASRRSEYFGTKGCEGRA